MIDAQSTPQLVDGMVIEDGTIYGALVGFLPMPMAAASALIGHDADTGIGDCIRE